MTRAQIFLIKEACLYAMANAKSLADSFALKECCDELDKMLDKS